MTKGQPATPSAVEVFGPDEPHDRVDQQGFKLSRDRIGTGLHGLRVNPVMRIRRERTSLSRFEVHDIIAYPTSISTLAVMFERVFAAFGKHGQRDAEAAIGRLGSCHRLKQQIHRRAAIHGCKLRRDMGQAAGLRGNLIGIHEALKGIQNRGNAVYRIGCRIDSDDRISAAVEQAFEGGQQNASRVVGRMIWLRTDGQNTTLSERIAAASYVANLRRSQDQVFVAHDLGRGSCHFGNQSGLQRSELFFIRAVAQQMLPEFAHRHGAHGRECPLIEALVDQPSDIVFNQGFGEDLLERNIGESALGRNSFLFGLRGDTGELVA